MEVHEDHTQVATIKLREDASETTTETMPYWAGASPSTIRRFKGFYAYCQWMATLGCLANGNPLWPLCIALPIQLASLLMTLVRKGLLTARGYHLLYTASLCVPFVVGECFGVESKRRRRANGPNIHAGLARGGAPFLALTPAAYALLFARRRLGRAPQWKYLIWAPVLLGRILAGDHAVFRAFL